MSKKFPLGEHLTKNLRRVALFARTLTTYISGLNGQNAIFLCPKSQKASKVTVLGKEKKMFFNLFCLHSWPKHELTTKSAPKFDTFAPFFDTFDFEPP